MKIVVNRIFNRLLMAIMAIGAVACSSLADNGEELQPGVDALMVSFRVVVPLASGSTSRAASVPDNGNHGNAGYWDDFTGVEATEFENALLARNFTVTLYNGDSFLGRVKAFALNKVSDGDGNTLRYDFHGILDLADPNMTEKGLQTITAKMMITANADPTESQLLSGLSSGTGLSAVTFDKIGTQETMDAIPMWGVATKSLAGIKRGELFDFGDVQLLRAMAKLVIDFDRSATSDCKDLIIDEVTVSNMNTTGYVLPGDWNTTIATTGLKLENTLRIPWQALQESTFIHNKEDAMVFYIPEILNDPVNETMLTVRYKVSPDAENGGEGHIVFRPYGEDGKPAAGATPWNIVRNHQYQFVITKIGDFYMQFNVSLLKWAVADDQVVQLPEKIKLNYEND